MKAIWNMLRLVLRRIFLPQRFYCGEVEQCVEFIGKNGKRAYIWVIQPDGNTKFRYAYWLSSKLTESQLKEIEGSTDKLEKAHEYKRSERDFRFFDAVYSRCKGYCDETGNDISYFDKLQQILLLKKWFPDHVERVIYWIFDDAINETVCKKKV